MPTNLSRVDDKRDVAVHHGCKLSERTDDNILPVKSVDSAGCRRCVNAQHELKIVDNHMRNVVHVHCM